MARGDNFGGGPTFSLQASANAIHPFITLIALYLKNSMTLIFFKLLQLADAHPMSISIKIYAFIRSPTQHTVQLNLNFTHACGYTQACTRFSCVKVYNVECIYFVACRFVVRTRAIKQLVLPSCTTRIS